MLIRMNSLLNIVNERGTKLDEGSIRRYLGEIVWYPSAALSSFIVWEEIDENRAKATMSYKGAVGSGYFTFDESGNFLRFRAYRYMGNKRTSERFEWVISVDDYTEFEGIRVPSRVNATWKIEGGDWEWLRLEIKEIKYWIKNNNDG